MRVDRFCVSCAQSCRRTQYIGLIGDRWQTLDIPYTHAVLLEEPPVGFEYLETS